ncbi:hypothetical protein [Nostoc sp. FACHB-110]|uniref:hypothetical protein n=1 Tax=Nostoc sp. FACHB-110 TaxID=2692834 RepID=UPI001A7E9C75|nr:hypothetical protein [Nostoc sp. FACHB-110]
MHLAPANGIRGYTNEVRLRGLTQYQGFGTRAGGFCLCSCDFSRLVQDMCILFFCLIKYILEQEFNSNIYPELINKITIKIAF